MARKIAKILKLYQPDHSDRCRVQCPLEGEEERVDGFAIKLSLSLGIIRQRSSPSASMSTT
jgi:hypothetical protein